MYNIYIYIYTVQQTVHTFFHDMYSICLHILRHNLDTCSGFWSLETVETIVLARHSLPRHVGKYEVIPYVDLLILHFTTFYPTPDALPCEEMGTLWHPPRFNVRVEWRPASGLWPAGCCDSLPAALCAETAGGRWAGDKHSKAVFNQLERLLDFSFEVSCLLNFIDVPDVPWSFWYSWIILDILIFLHLLRLTVWYDLIYQDFMIWHDMWCCSTKKFRNDQKWPILNWRKL